MVRVKVIEEVRAADPQTEQADTPDRVKQADAARHVVKTLSARGVLQWNGGKPTGLKGVRVKRHAVSETVVEGRR